MWRNWRKRACKAFEQKVGKSLARSLSIFYENYKNALQTLISNYYPPTDALKLRPKLLPTHLMSGNTTCIILQDVVYQTAEK